MRSTSSKNGARLRRRALHLALAVAACAVAHAPPVYPQPTAAAGAPAPWQVPMRLLEGDDGAWRAQALSSLAVALRVRTSIEAAPAAVLVAPTAAELFAAPLLFWSARDAAPLPPDAEVALAQYLAHGGLLVIDGDPVRDARFLAQAEAAATRALPPDAALEPLRDGDILLHTFYLLPRAEGRAGGDVRVARVGGQIGLIVSHLDLLGAAASGADATSEGATRLLVNTVMYALCLDYKDDQVHAPFLMRRRRGQP